MNKIRVMDETLANKIAAGEVVEKCSSIIKELCENSIDAGATIIEVNLIEGGKKKIEVIDNGSGMSREDAHLSFQRHATSKIYKDDDLFFIDTLGFRGEALPSIASVSKTEMTTSDGAVGTHIIIEGGHIIVDEPGALRKGTKITVTNLFYNTPARLKYLKSDPAELAGCVSYLEKLSLAHPNISFTLNHDGKDLVKTSGSGDLLKTIHEIYGVSVSSKMIEVKNSNDDFDLQGYIAKPEILKSNRNHMIVMVNGRVVKNYDVNKAINDAYYTYKPDIKFPIVVLNIYTDPTLIDVNIHPTKQDIKIEKMPVLYDLIYNTLKQALYKALLIPDAVLRMPESNPFKEEILENVVKETEEEVKPTNIQTTFDFVRAEESETKEAPTEEVVVNPEMKKLKLFLL